MPRPRLSAAQKRLRGTYRADRSAPAAPSERLSRCPPPPATLTDAGTAEWKRLAPIAHRLGTLCAADLRAFELLCMTLATAAEAEATIRREGMTLPTGSGGTRAHPAIRIMEGSRAQAARLLIEFGLTPRARNAVEPAPPP